MATMPALQTHIEPGFVQPAAFQHFPADTFPTIHPVHWLHSHFAVGGWSPLSRLSGMLTAHMTRIAPHNGFTWHPHRGLEIYTWVLEGTLYHEDTTGGKGTIGPGELQRMFSGDYIEHQELNLTDDPARVIQIWYVADPKFRHLEPHYQQPDRSAFPNRKIGAATVHTLIGEGSPMTQHITGRLTATTIPAGGQTILETPNPGEDLFVYMTDGSGSAAHNGDPITVGQYDAILTKSDAKVITVAASEDDPLHYLSFYLPSFIP